MLATNTLISAAIVTFASMVSTETTRTRIQQLRNELKELIVGAADEERVNAAPFGQKVGGLLKVA